MVKSTTTHAENTGAWQLSVIRNSCPMRSLTHKQLNHSKKDTENVYEINKKIMDVMFFSSQGFTFFLKLWLIWSSLNSQISPYLCLPSAGIEGVHHHQHPMNVIHFFKAYFLLFLIMYLCVRVHMSVSASRG